MKRSEIKFIVTLDKENIPEKIEWNADDNISDGLSETKSISLSLWDENKNNTLRIDLWTKKMKTSDMKKFTEELCVLNQYYDNCGEVPRAKRAWNQTPNEFESKLQRFFFDISPIMACAEYSCVVNSPNNRVQNTVANRSGDVYNYTALDLKYEFDEGRRISLDRITIDDIICPHQEINILEGLS